MSEAVEGRIAAERRWAAKGPRWAGREWEDAGPPSLGTEVDGYRLERRLGEGGQGTVYRARRGRRLYALKFLSLDSPDWAWRELEVRLRLRRVLARGALRLGAPDGRVDAGRAPPQVRWLQVGTDAVTGNTRARYPREEGDRAPWLPRTADYLISLSSGFASVVPLSLVQSMTGVCHDMPVSSGSGSSFSNSKPSPPK